MIGKIGAGSRMKKEEAELRLCAYPVFLTRFVTEPVPVPGTGAEHAGEPTRCCLKRLRKTTRCSAKKTGHGHGHGHRHEQNAGTAESIGISLAESVVSGRQ